MTNFNSTKTFMLTFGANKHTANWTICRPLTLQEIGQLLTTHDTREPKDGHAYVPGVLIDGRRTKDTVAEIHMVVLDIDGKHSIPDVEHRIEQSGLYAICHTTHSHQTTGLDKMRIALPLQTPIVLAELGPNPSEAYRAIYRGIAQLLGLAVDTECSDPNRLFYLPSCPPEMAPQKWSRRFTGQLLDWTTVARVEPDRRPKGAANKTSAAHHVIADWVKGNPKADIEGLLTGRLKAEVIDRRGKGGVIIRCPFETDHTQAGGNGTFAANADDDHASWCVECLHESCLGRTRTDFILAWLAQGKITLADLGIDIWQMPNGNFTVPSCQLTAALAQFNERWATVSVKGKTRYVRLKDCEFFDKANFVNYHEACKAWVRTKDTDKKVSFATCWLQWQKRNQYAGFGFYPAGDVPDGHFNLWRGFAVEPREGDWGLMRAHILDNVCRGNQQCYDWLLDWLAALFQNPADKTGTHVVLTGEEGTGKSIVGKWIAKAFGPHAMTIGSGDRLVGRFNAHFETLLFALAEEVFWAGDKAAEGVLKTLATSEMLSYERKGFESHDGKNYTRLWITSNEPWAVPAWSGGRRWMALEVGNAHARDTAYFAAIEQQMRNGGLAAMLDELLNRKITADLRNAPETQGLIDQRIASADTKQMWLRELIADGGFGVQGLESAGWVDLNMDAITPVRRNDLFANGERFFEKRGRPATKIVVAKWLKKELGDLFQEGGRETAYHLS
jgi:hypothetical protein